MHRKPRLHNIAGGEKKTYVNSSFQREMFSVITGQYKAKDDFGFLVFPQTTAEDP
jgi:hypothetical protein